MKEVNIYVRGVVKNIDEDPYRIGEWVTVLEYNKRFKMIQGTENTTKNGRAVTIGIIEGIKLLKEPCNINLYTHVIFFKRSKESRIKDEYKFRPIGTHKDLLEELDKLITDNNHILNIYIGGKYQKELMKYI